LSIRRTPGCDKRRSFTWARSDALVADRYSIETSGGLQVGLLTPATPEETAVGTPCRDIGTRMFTTESITAALGPGRKISRKLATR
jgi:hypothetical protein